MRYWQKICIVLLFVMFAPGLTGCNDNNINTPTGTAEPALPDRRPQYPDRGQHDPNRTPPPRNPDGSLG